MLFRLLFSRLKALKWVRQQVWKQLREAYSRERDLQVPHRFQFGDLVYIRRHCAENLESRWKSPYLVLLTTLLSALMRPFVILLLLLTIGTCVINRLIVFIREHISAVQILMLCQQYQRLGQDNPEYIESEI